MYQYARRSIWLCVAVCAWILGSPTPEMAVAGARPSRKTVRNNRVQRSRKAIPFSGGVTRLATDSQESLGSVSAAAGLPGVSVYSNEINPAMYVYPPRADQRMADDLRLAGGGCDVVYYDLVVAGDGDALNGLLFDVDVELWDGDPCLAESTPIAGSAKSFVGLQNALLAQTLSFTFDPGPPGDPNPPVSVPGTVWLAATFSSDSGGWVVAEEAEAGHTADFWSEDNLESDPPQCNLFRDGGNPPNRPVPFYGGYWANVRCDIPPPTGACCDGETCSEVTQAECITGVWQGDFSTCDPNPCIAGACCAGSDLMTCSDSDEAACELEAGLFHAGDLCSQSPCQPTFQVYANNFDTGERTIIEAETLIADDLDLGPTAPCELLAFDVTMKSDLSATPYDVRAELWTNDDNGTLANEFDDIPGDMIAGTGMDFLGVPGSGIERKLIAGSFSGIQLDRKIWLVLSSSRPDSGPVLAGAADPGSSRDFFAVFNDSGSPGIWDPTFTFGGFNPIGCPLDSPCNPAASFKVNVWCAGDPPPGACCDAVSGTCIDNVAWGECPGRWAQGVSCNSNPFDPPCGTSACCTVEPIADCLDTTPSFCEDLGGVAAIGSLCDDLDFSCPRPLCLRATGDCTTVHGGLGCNDPFCCEAVCVADNWCCNVTEPEAEWDDACALEAASCPASAPCPSGPVRFVDPPSGIIDARQPHPPLDLANRQGLQSFIVEAPPGADNLLCWQRCESIVETSSNMITSVVDIGGGRFSVNLLRSISSGGVTTITYMDDNAVSQSGSFISHPANVDGGGQAGASDVIAVMDCVSGLSVCEIWECDTDHSGQCTPADTLRVIDLLQGAGQFDVWAGTPLPAGCP